jgi:aldose 1-epimerase
VNPAAGQGAEPATGAQLVLRRHGAQALVGELAAVLRGFAVDGTAYTETWPDDELPPMGCGIVLVPWPNRVAGARWSLAGRAQQLDITEPGRGNASHGLLRNTGYLVTDRSPDAVRLSATVFPQHGYPFHLQTAVQYRLTDQGLRVTHTLHNVGSAAAPFGVGAHPYLRIGDTPPADLTVTVAADTMVTVDERQIPLDRVPVVGTEFDLRGGAGVGGLGADTGFTDLTPAADGRFQHLLRAPDGRGLMLWTDPDFQWVQVFTPDSFPTPGHPDSRTAIAIEPMTCAADAFNNGWGLRRLEPGETWSGSWGLTPLPASPVRALDAPNAAG